METPLAEVTISSLLDICMNTEGTFLQAKLDSCIGTNFGYDLFIEENGNTLLHILARNDSFNSWDIILKYFLYINSQNKQQETPLYVSVQNHNLSAIEALILNGANPTIPDHHDINPIQLCCKINYSKGLQMILKSYQARTYCNTNIIYLAMICVNHDALKCFKSLLDFVSTNSLNSLDKNGNGLIHNLVYYTDNEHYNIDFLLYLLETKYDFNQKNKQGKTIIEMGGIYKIPERAQLILQSKMIKSRSQAKTVRLSNNSSVINDILFKAVQDGDTQYVNDYNDKIDVVDMYSKTPLIYSLINGKETMINSLLKKDASPNFQAGLFIRKYDNTPCGSNAYHVAALNGLKNALSIFIRFSEQNLEHRPDFTLIDQKGRNLLHCALISKNPEIITLVLSYKPNLEFNVSYILKALYKMEDKTMAQFIEVLLINKFPKDAKDDRGESMLHYAITRKYNEFALMLLDKKAYIEEELDEILVLAIKNASPHIESIFKLKDNFSMMYQGMTLLHLSVYQADDSVFQTMLRLKPELAEIKDTQGNTLLHRCVIANNISLLKRIISDYKSLTNETNDNEETPLNLLMQDYSPNFVEMFKLLIENGAEPKHLNNMKRNILHIAAEHNNNEAIDILISNESSLMSNEDIDELMNQLDDEQYLPIELSATNSDLSSTYSFMKKVDLPIFKATISEEIIDSYLAKEMNPNVKNSEGIPLIAFIINYNELDISIKIKCVSKLLETGADPSITDDNNLAPLHHAIRTGNIELTQVLIDHGACFIVEPVIRVFAEKEQQYDLIDIILKPEKRASAVHEVIVTQANVVETLDHILVFTSRFKEELLITSYMHEIGQMHRLLKMFVSTLSRLFKKMKPSSEFGDFFLFFADSFLPLLGIPNLYHLALSELNEYPQASLILKESINYNDYNLSDGLIVPVQQLTRYHELIKAIMKATPPTHPDYSQLQKAHVKYGNIGRIANERMLIAESQEKLSSISIKTSIKEIRQISCKANDVLLIHGNFERKSYTGGPKSGGNCESTQWGLHINHATSGKLEVKYYSAISKSLRQFLKAPKISLYLLKNTALFGIQKSTDKFKLKYSCRSDELLWDFSRDYGSDSFVVWTPIGQFLLKLDPPKGTNADFERNQWKTSVEKLQKAEESEKSPGFEICFTAWVGKQTGCVHTQLFKVNCSSREEAKTKITEKMDELGVEIATKKNPMGEMEKLINYHFQTNIGQDGQKSDILSGIEASHLFTSTK